MTEYTILQYPDPRLKKVAKSVDVVDSTIQALVDDMFRIMYREGGAGLAAPQLGISKCIVVMDIALKNGAPQPLCFINPRITESHGKHTMPEGCLSLPDISAEITRASHITVNALNRHGEPFELQATGLLATCIQHEIDHLYGKVFFDRISTLKRQRLQKMLLKKQLVS